MASYQSLVTPNLNARANAGNCLVMAQNITGAPVANPTATVAANATKIRHATRQMPNAVCVLWFDHWGTYGEPPRYDNFGHVVVYVPGRGFASSSPNWWEANNSNTGGGIYWYSSIGAVESTFNARFRFWTEDINGKRVCKPVSTPTPPPAPIEEEDDMIFIRTSSAGAVYAWSPLTRKTSAKGLSRAEWDAIKVAYAESNGRGAPVVTVSPAVFQSMTGRKG